MNWILDHLQIIIAVAAAIAYWLNQRRQEKDGGEAPREGDFAEPAHTDAEEMERTRRIQEEIRRKIAERAGGGPIAVPPPAPEPPPLFRSESGAPRPVASPLPAREFRRAPGPVTTEAADATAAVLERQRRLEEQMRALAETRRSAQRKAAALATTQAARVQAAAPARGDLLADLRGARNLRRAVVLREVLGPPVALR